MTTIDLIRRVAALGLVVAASVRLEAGARAQVASAPRGGGVVAPIAPVVPQTGIGPVLPNPNAPSHFVAPPPILSPNAAVGGDLGAFGVGGGFGGFGVGGGFAGFGVAGFGAGGFGYPGMYGGFGAPYGGFGISLPPTPELGSGAYRAGNHFAGPTTGMGMEDGVPADSDAPPAGNGRRRAIGVPSEDPFDAAGAADRPPSREIRSKRTHPGRRPTARQPARQPSRKPEARASEAEPNRSEVKRMRTEQPAASQEKPAAAAKAEGAKPVARPRSMLGSPR